MWTALPVDFLVMQGAYENKRFRGIVGGAWDAFKVKLLLAVRAFLVMVLWVHG